MISLSIGRTQTGDLCRATRVEYRRKEVGLAKLSNFVPLCLDKVTILPLLCFATPLKRL